RRGLQSLRRGVSISGKTLALLAFIALPLAGQRGAGELRLSVKDPSGLGLEATGSLLGQATQLRQTITTDPQRRYAVRLLPDGIPIFDNRSPAFAPALDVEELQSMNVLTGNYPAEFGRKLGGVIDVVTARDSTPGFHGKAALQAGSFSTQSGYLSGQYIFGRT